MVLRRNSHGILISTKVRLFIVTGEHSGDMHASMIVGELKSRDVNIQVSGWGGTHLRDKGVALTRDIQELGQMGYSDVLRRGLGWLKILNECKNDIIKSKANQLLLVDFSSFNMRIAKWAKQRNITVHFYIAPKTWASRGTRNNAIRKYVDHLHCIFPFEENYFRELGINAHYIGNPSKVLLSRHTYAPQDQIAFLPGSRIQEVKKMLPLLNEIITSFPDVNWVISRVKHIPLSLYTRLLTKQTLAKVNISNESASSILGKSKYAIITSGTATLEAAIIGCPHVVIYKTSGLNFLIGKQIIKTSFISLPNILLERKVVPELIQSQCHAINIINTLNNLESTSALRKMKDGFSEILSLLGEKIPHEELSNHIIKVTS